MTILISFSISPIRATSEFSTSYDFLYEVLESGVTNVTQNITLTNLTTAYYPSRYTITYGTEKIENLFAFQNSQPLKTNIAHGLNKTSVEINFNDKVVGVKKTINFILTYQSTAFARQEGQIWKINLPPPAPTENFTSYSAQLKFPLGFGVPSYVSPVPKTNYEWNQKDNLQQGIILAFGNRQNYQFSGNFTLKNSSILPTIMELTLPISNSYQRISSISLNPKPRKSNRYFLWPFQTLKVKAAGYAEVFQYPFKIIGLPKDSQIIYASKP